MNGNFERFGGLSGMIVGALSLLYAVFFLLVSKGPDDGGRLVSWVILAVSGVFTSAAYVALYLRMRSQSEGYALWGLLLGLAQSAFTLTNGVYQSLLINAALSGQLSKATFDAAQQLPNPGDPKGVWTFVVFAMTSFIFGRLILQSGSLPRNLGYVALLNAILLLLLFIGNVLSLTPLILASGGLTSVIVTPVWWIWLGRELGNQRTAVVRERAPA